MKVLVIKNRQRERLGSILDILHEYGIERDVADLHKGDKFPDPRNYKAVIVLGGPDSANDQTEKMISELEKVKDTVEAGIPYLGICLGMQVLVKALGGKVLKNPVKEVGWRDDQENFFVVSRTEEGRNDPLLAGLKSPFETFQLHFDTVELTDGMKLLATSNDCRNQVVKLNDITYGIQSHFELNDDMLQEWIEKDPDLKHLDGQSLRDDYEEIKEEYHETARIIFTNFFKIAGLID